MSSKSEEAKRQLAHNEQRLLELKREDDLLKHQLAEKEREVKVRESAIESGKRKVGEAEQEERHKSEREERTKQEHQGREKQGPEKREGLGTVFDRL